MAGLLAERTQMDEPRVDAGLDVQGKPYVDLIFDGSDVIMSPREALIAGVGLIVGAGTALTDTAIVQVVQTASGADSETAARFLADVRATRARLEEDLEEMGPGENP